MYRRGWNYVDCMESIVWADTFDHDQDCWKLRTFCRDVLTTPAMDEYGHGVTPSNYQNNALVLTLAVLSGFVGSIMVFMAMRGGWRRKHDDAHGDVQFSALRTHEMMVD